MRIKSFGQGASVLALACAMQAAPGRSQEADMTADGGIALDPITIYATLSPTASFDYPGQVSVVDRERIESLQASDLDDLFKGVPGAVVDGGPRRSGQAPTIRGNREEDVLVLLDGVRQNFISGHDGRIFVEPELLKQVEVVKGPISSLYGSGALGGVIALTTVDAADFLDEGETSAVRVKAGFQSVNDEFLISTTAFTRSHDGKWDIIGNVSYRESGDVELGNGVSLPDEHEIKSGLLKGTVQLSPGLSFNASWVHYSDDALNPNNPQGNNNGGSGGVVDVFRYVLSDTVQGTLSYNPADNDLIDGNLQVYWTRSEVEEDEVNSARILSREVETTGIKLDNRSRFAIVDWGKLTLTYGTEYYHDLQSGEDNAPLGSLPLFPGDPFANPGALGNIPSGTADFFGVFTQAELVVGQPLGAPGELTLLPGVRWDKFSNSFDGEGTDFDDIDETAISPKFGASYKPVEWLLLFGNYGEAFRAPSFNEAYATGNHFPIFGPTGFAGYNRFIPNPDLKPQDGSMIEVGAGLDFKNVLAHGDAVKVKGSYWKSDVDNFIDLEVLAFTSQNVNRENAELDGVEIELTYDTDRYFGRVGYSTIDGVDTTTGDFLGVLQPDKLYVEAGVKVPEIWSRFGTRVTFADDFDKVNLDTQTGELPVRDGYATVDLFAVIEPLDGPLKGLRLDLGIDNIFDEEYEVISAGAVEPGINFKAAAAWIYKW